ncbi:molybdenum cofactor guanylyltransferase [Paenibacillus lentus]|uniref:Probable molybdenum cofactor guanylyltransferase n=1 Tax=Paenibacillus lentus TaxID=1338368 RepID=A0A3Q8S461_9BACL|nr:molybdenum cofactor guanylyltransferase [Paenibacillus lentus]AZK45844.1 molybdenum cofactor guanylyltransferase [Paenibacillus lentus]
MEWTAIILAGGKSSRMGTNKAVLPLGGQPVIEHLVRELQKATGNIVISCGQSSEYAELGLPLLYDIYPRCGPLAGLHAGLAASPHRWNLVVSCDMPFVNASLAQYLVKQALELEGRGAEDGGRAIEAVIPRVNGQIHPLLAMYRCTVLPGLEQMLDDGCLKVKQWTSGLAVRYITGEELSRASGIPLEMIVFNMNRPEDYQAAQFYFEQNKT